MPKATLLKKSWEDYRVLFGKSAFDFYGGETKEVPVAVALELRKKVDREGHLMFKIEDLPTIIRSDQKSAASDCKPVEKQNVVGNDYQMRFAGWA